MLTVTLVVAPLTVAPEGVPFTWTVTEPAAVPEATVIVKTLPWVGVTLDGLNEVQVTPEGRGVMHDKVTGCGVPAVSLAVIVTVPLLPDWIVAGPLFDNE
jgi:hypothetical protein